MPFVEQKGSIEEFRALVREILAESKRFSKSFREELERILTKASDFRRISVRRLRTAVFRELSRVAASFERLQRALPSTFEQIRRAEQAIFVEELRSFEELSKEYREARRLVRSRRAWARRLEAFLKQVDALLYQLSWRKWELAERPSYAAFAQQATTQIAALLSQTERLLGELSVRDSSIVVSFREMSAALNRYAQTLQVQAQSCADLRRYLSNVEETAAAAAIDQAVAYSTSADPMLPVLFERAIQASLSRVSGVPAIVASRLQWVMVGSLTNLHNRLARILQTKAPRWQQLCEAIGQRVVFAELLQLVPGNMHQSFIRKQTLPDDVEHAGGKWAPLKYSTIQRKRREGWPLRIGVRTGTLERRLRYWRTRGEILAKQEENKVTEMVVRLRGAPAAVLQARVGPWRVQVTKDWSALWQPTALSKSFTALYFLHHGSRWQPARPLTAFRARDAIRIGNRVAAHLYTVSRRIGAQFASIFASAVRDYIDPVAKVLKERWLETVADRVDARLARAIGRLGFVGARGLSAEALAQLREISRSVETVSLEDLSRWGLKIPSVTYGTP